MREREPRANFPPQNVCADDGIPLYCYHLAFVFADAVSASSLKICGQPKRVRGEMGH